ncbi:hypothetical protein KY285_000773 [Solanum tuberosum]|nr:hypothetical protein KY285_000773 [Solanum tuberosum]
MENKQHSSAKFLTSKVHPPVIGAFPLVRKMLDISHHLPEWLSTERKDVTDNFSGNVTTEKVLLLKSSTHQNVVVAIPPRRDENLSSWRVSSSGFGESIHQYGLYLRQRVIYLFMGFENHWSKGAIDEVSFQEWTKFWFRGPRKYVEPSPTTSKNLTKPRMNHDPSRNIDMSSLPRTEEENAPFAELGVVESFRDETYLATFLACWFCKFVLPNKKADCIRASVLKVSRLMSHGEIFSLAVPVLASIYRGLRDIYTSSNLGSCDILLPIHYVYGWIGWYFETYYRVTRPQRGVRMWKISGKKMEKHFDLVDARKLFQQVNVHNLHNLAMLQGKELHIDDSGKLSISQSDFLIGLCSSFVTFRLDDELIVEPYSPHRFSRQFGYCQDVPGALIEHHYDGFSARFGETKGFMCSSWKLFEDHHTNASIQ